MRFRKGDGRSRAQSWTKRTAESLQRFAEARGLYVAATQPGTWGSAYLAIECEQPECSACWEEGERITNIRGEEVACSPVLDIRIANHAEGSGYEHGHPAPDINLHNEPGERSPAERIKAAKRQIAEFAKRHAQPAAELQQ